MSLLSRAPICVRVLKKSSCPGLYVYATLVDCKTVRHYVAATTEQRYAYQSFAGTVALITPRFRLWIPRNRTILSRAGWNRLITNKYSVPTSTLDSLTLDILSIAVNQNLGHPNPQTSFLCIPSIPPSRSHALLNVPIHKDIWRLLSQASDL